MTDILAIEQAVAARLLTKTSAEWDVLFAQAKAVAGGVQSLEQTLASGQTNGSRPTSTGRNQGWPHNRSQPLAIASMTPFFGPTGDVPLLGQHSTEVLKDFDYSDDDIAPIGYPTGR